MLRHALLVQFGQPSFEIIVHQRDRQVRRAIDDANAEFAQGGTEFRRALHVDRFNAHPAISEILLRHAWRQAEARPIAGYSAGGRVRCRNDIAALDKPLESFLDLVGWKIPSPVRQRALESSCRPFRWRRRGRNKARREGRTCGPRSRGRRRRAAAHRPRNSARIAERLCRRRASIWFGDHGSRRQHARPVCRSGSVL